MVLSLLYRDDHCVAVAKPAGLLVHRSKLDRSATQFALQTVRNQIGQRVYPVHRLDKPTSGVLLFALHPEAARRLTAAFTERQVQKTYLALVRGHLPESGLIDRPLAERLDKTTDARARPGKPPQPARTRFRRLAMAEVPHAVSRYPTSRYALVEAHPETGRQHQIRRHLAGIDHPVIGDGKHGDYRHNRFFREPFGCTRLLLHAAALSIPHPMTGAPLQLTAPLDPDFADVLDALGLDART